MADTATRRGGHSRADISRPELRLEILPNYFHGAVANLEQCPWPSSWRHHTICVCKSEDFHTSDEEEAQNNIYTLADLVYQLQSSCRHRDIFCRIFGSLDFQC